MEENKIYDTNLLIEGKVKRTTIFNIIEFPKALERDLEIIFPTKEEYLKAIEIMLALLKMGKPIPAIDTLIAAMCIKRDLTLFPEFKLELR